MNIPHLKKGQVPIFVFMIVSIIAFTLSFISRSNFEFLLYVGVIIVFMIILMLSNHKVEYPNPLLWALSIWAFLHMAGGAILIDGVVLYKLLLFNWIGEPYYILKYDQVIHAYGFFTATLLSYYILRNQLRKHFSWGKVLFVVIFAGLGLGALNEIIEFTVTVLVPETNVGGYVNTALDLVFNFLGCLIAGLFIYFYERKKN
jgi:uncharacterized membrane protein YjdF